MTYAAESQVRLAAKGIEITQDQINDGIDILAIGNHIGRDAETSLVTFLEHLNPPRFPGWAEVRQQLNDDTRDMTNEQRNNTWAKQYGNDAVRVAGAVASRG